MVQPAAGAAGRASGLRLDGLRGQLLRFWIVAQYSFFAMGRLASCATGVTGAASAPLATVESPHLTAPLADASLADLERVCAPSGHPRCRECCQCIFRFRRLEPVPFCAAGSSAVPRQGRDAVVERFRSQPMKSGAVARYEIGGCSCGACRSAATHTAATVAAVANRHEPLQVPSSPDGSLTTVAARCLRMSPAAAVHRAQSARLLLDRAPRPEAAVHRSRRQVFRRRCRPPLELSLLTRERLGVSPDP